MLCIARKHLNYLTSRSLRSTKLLLPSNIICLKIVTPLHKLSITLMRLKKFAPRDYLKSLLPFISKQDKKIILSDVVLGLIICCHWGNWILLLSLVKRWSSPHADSTLYRKSIMTKNPFPKQNIVDIFVLSLNYDTLKILGGKKYMKRKKNKKESYFDNIPSFSSIIAKKRFAPYE